MREGSEVVRDRAQSGARFRQFGKAPADAAPEDKAPEGVFDRGPPHRAGDIEQVAPGIERRWLNPYCYREFGRRPELFTASPFRGNPVRCNLPAEGDTDLFDHLKPKYLQPPK